MSAIDGDYLEGFEDGRGEGRIEGALFVAMVCLLIATFFLLPWNSV